MAGKNKTRLVGWHPSDPAAVGWLDAEIARRGGGRGAQSGILDEALERAMTGTTRLTDADRRVIARFRAFDAAKDADAIREHTGDADLDMAYPAMVGEARYLLGEMAAIIERLGGPPV